MPVILSGMIDVKFIVPALLLFSSVVAQEMRKAEEPDEVGLVEVSDDFENNSSESLPLQTTNFRPENAFTVAPGLKGNSPYCFTITARSESPVTGRATCETNAVYYGKHTPLQMPATAGKWKRVSFFFRTAPGTREASFRFGRSADGKSIEAKDPHLRDASEEEFTAAWKNWRAHYPERDLSPRPGDGQNLKRFINLLQNPGPGRNEVLVYGIGSSYTNMLGNGERLNQWVRAHFPNAPKVVYKKHVGSAVAYDFTRGWMRQLVLGEDPDLVILYSEGTGEDLDKLLKDFRSHSAADVIVASLHLRERAGENTPATVHQQQWKEVRKVAEKYNCEWVDNRVEHAAYLTEHKQPLTWLLKDAVHQSDHGALVINENIVRHIVPQEVPSTELVHSVKDVEGACRIDFYGEKSQQGKSIPVMTNGRPAAGFPAFVTTRIIPGPKNHKPARGSTADRSPHMVRLGDVNKIVPQEWTIIMTSDDGNFALSGSVTGKDGSGNNGTDFTSNSGQITVPTELWRRRINPDGTHANKTGDTFTWRVKRSTVGEIDFSGKDGKPFRVTLINQIPPRKITIEIEPPKQGEGKITGYEIIKPALP